MVVTLVFTFIKFKKKKSFSIGQSIYVWDTVFIGGCITSVWVTLPLSRLNQVDEFLPWTFTWSYWCARKLKVRLTDGTRSRWCELSSEEFKVPSNGQMRKTLLIQNPQFPFKNPRQFIKKLLSPIPEYNPK